MASFEVKLTEDISIAQLQQLMTQNIHVSRTGHLGNHYLANLLQFSCGIPCHIFDRNQIIRDENYWPEYLLINQQQVKLVEFHSIVLLQMTLRLLSVQ